MQKNCSSTLFLEQFSWICKYMYKVWLLMDNITRSLNMIAMKVKEEI